MSLTTCKICDNQYDQDFHAGHEDMCREQEVEHAFNAQMGNPMQAIDELVVEARKIDKKHKGFICLNCGKMNKPKTQKCIHCKGKMKLNIIFDNETK